MAQQCLDRDITIDAEDHPITVSFNGRPIAQTTEALSLKEEGYPPVLYIPVQDVNKDVLQDSDHKSICPFKGEASYYSLKDGAAVSDNAVWYYPDPCPLVDKVRGHVAFWGPDVSFSD